MTTLSNTIESTPTEAAPRAMDARTRTMLEAPLPMTLLRMGLPNVLVMAAQASAALIETYFIGKLGTDALAGMSLVFPVVMLMQMMSAGAVGGGIASAIARALGAGRRSDADALVLHSLLIAVAFGLFFMVLVLGGGRWLFAAMGGSGAALEAAMIYANWVFGGAILVWLFNSLGAVVRGTGNMALPAIVTVAGTVFLIPVSPLLIFGAGPIPALGIAGGAIALLSFYVIGALVMVGYLWSGRSPLHPALARSGFRRALFGDILRVGLVGSISTVASNVTIATGTALVGHFGIAAIAGYGTASRLEYLLVPLAFGLGAPLVTIVGTCIGAGNPERALQATWIGAAFSFVLTESIGLWAAFFPHAWLTLFDTDPVMLETGSHYLRIVGPTYGFFGLGLTLYFASQGAGRLMWPVLASVSRMVVAAGIGYLAFRAGSGIGAVFAAQAVALLVYGALNAGSVAGGAWFGRIGWPASTGVLVRRLGLRQRLKPV
jgi:putative MATE family efflux protein